MIESEINKRYCQSCGMPLRFDVEKYLGTNSDGSRSDEYCYYCLKDGKYIVDIPMSDNRELSEIVVSVKMPITRDGTKRPRDPLL